MATNKHAIIRYQTLDRCFRNPGRRYYIDNLIEECNKAIYEFTGSDIGIKRRQIFEDIKFMESSQGWNVELDRIRDGHRVYYRYADISKSINNQPLNEMEENQLKEALLTLSRFKGMPQFEWVDEISAKLDSGLGLSKQNGKFIEFEQNSYLKGLEFITPIYTAMLYKSAINIQYKSFKLDIEQTIVLHPYYLKQFNNRWFIFGKIDASDYLSNLALDRIITIEKSQKKFIPNSTIDFDDYFEDIVGVTLNSNQTIKNVLLKVKNNLFPYIQTKPLHGSQKVKDKTENHTLISLDLFPNFELESLLLSHGEGIEILAPLSLRERIKNRIEMMAEQYKN